MLRNFPVSPLGVSRREALAGPSLISSVSCGPCSQAMEAWLGNFRNENHLPVAENPGGLACGASNRNAGGLPLLPLAVRYKSSWHVGSIPRKIYANLHGTIRGSERQTGT
jgi:hypothetical protein